MSNKPPERIPTLTNIVKVGDQSMENHFDGHFLDEIQESDEPDTAAVKLNQNTIDDLINDVVHTTMPIIERQLRNQLTGILKKYTKNDVDG